MTLVWSWKKFICWVEDYVCMQVKYVKQRKGEREEERRNGQGYGRVCERGREEREGRRERERERERGREGEREREGRS